MSAIIWLPCVHLTFFQTTLACSIYEVIGKGMHSVVYKGRKKKTIEYFAIKSVVKSQKQRVHQEVCCLLNKHMAISRGH